MPGEQAVLGRQAGDGEYLDGLIGDQRGEHRGCRAWVFEDDRRNVDDASVAVAKRTIAADEFPDAVTAWSICRRRGGFVQHVVLPSVRARPCGRRTRGVSTVGVEVTG